MDNSRKQGILSVIASVLAALFGVQSEANRQRDFGHGNPLTYIIVGAIFAISFVLALVLVVKMVVA